MTPTWRHVPGFIIRMATQVMAQVTNRESRNYVVVEDDGGDQVRSLSGKGAVDASWRGKAVALEAVWADPRLLEAVPE